MSGLIKFFNCTDTTLYYNGGNNDLTPLVIYPMRSASWETGQGGSLGFADGNNNPVATVDQASRTLAVSDSSLYAASAWSPPIWDHAPSQVVLYKAGSPDPTSWMGDSLAVIGTKTLREICIPGSHDAGMSQCQDGTVAAHPCNVITQSQSIGQQLALGTRYFDLRPTKVGNNYFTGHYNNIKNGSTTLTWQGANGESIDAIISDVNAFLKQPNCSELIIFNLSEAINTNFSNTNYQRFSQDDYNGLMAQLNTVSCLYTNTQAGIDITQIPINSIIGSGAGVIFIIDDTDESGTPISTGTYTGKGFFTASAFPTYNSYSDAQDVNVMAADQFNKMRRERAAGNYFLLSWTLTQDGSQAATCWLNKGAGTGISAGLGALFGTLIPGLGTLVGAIAGMGAGAAAADIAGCSVTELASLANLSLLERVPANITSTIFPNIIFTDLIETTNPLLVCLGINDGSIFPNQDPESLALGKWSVSNNSLELQPGNVTSDVSPALAARQNPFFDQLYRVIKTDDNNQLSLNCYVHGNDWRQVGFSGLKSATAFSSAWFNNQFFVAYSYLDQLYLANSGYWQLYYHVQNGASLCNTQVAPSITVWNNQLCLAYTDMTGTVHVLASSTGLDRAEWTPLGAASLNATSNVSTVLTTTMQNGQESLALMFNANGSVAGQAANTLFTAILAPNSQSWTISGTGVSCTGAFTFASLGNNLYAAFVNNGNAVFYTQAGNSVVWSGIPAPQATIQQDFCICGDEANNRLVLGYVNQNSYVYLNDYELSTGAWGAPVNTGVQGIMPNFTQNTDHLKMGFLTQGYMCYTPSASSAGWGVEQPLLNFSSPLAPALAWFNETLYMAFIANDGSNGILVASSVNGTDWSSVISTGFKSANAPALAVANNILYLAFTSMDGTNGLQLASLMETGTWGLTLYNGPQSPGAPSLAACNNILYMAYRGAANNLHIVSTGDAKSWSAPLTLTYMNGTQQNQSSFGSPSLTSLNGNLYMLYRSADSSNELYLASSSDQWSSATQVGDISRNAPCMVGYNGNLVYAAVNRLPGTNTLLAGQSLNSGSSLLSNNGVFELQVSPTGLSLYCTVSSAVYWTKAASSVNGIALHHNGNLEALGAPATEKFVWQMPANTTVTRLTVEDDGTLLLYYTNGLAQKVFGTAQNSIPDTATVHS
jgi:hypothetical protein